MQGRKLVQLPQITFHRLTSLLFVRIQNNTGELVRGISLTDCVIVKMYCHTLNDNTMKSLLTFTKTVSICVKSSVLLLYVRSLLNASC